MKILDPIHEIPRPGWLKYTPIWARLEQMSNGDWLPVDMETHAEAHKLYAAAKHRDSLEVRTRRAIVYLRKRKP